MFQKVNTRVYFSQHIFVMKQLCIYYFLVVIFFLLFLMLMLYFSSFSGHIYSYGIIKV